MVTKVIQRGFGAGEITPSLFARTDLNQYAMGSRKLENFIVLPQGAVRTRAGFRFVGQAINSNLPVRLIPFRYSSEQTYALEFGDKTLRIIDHGQYIANNNGDVYQISTPYAAVDLADIDYAQNADVLTLTSPEYMPYELRRYGYNDWRFVAVSVTPNVTPPKGLSYTAIYPSSMTDSEEKTKDKIECNYVVTAVDANEKESLASSNLVARGNYYISGAKIRVQWQGVAGASYYKVYRMVAGIYGFIGETEELYIDDEGNNPDTTTTPPKYKSVFTQSVKGQISTITINNGGSGYYYGLNSNTYYLPRVITIRTVPPLVSAKANSKDADAVTKFLPSVTLEVLDGSSGQVYLSSNIELTTKVVSSTVEDEGYLFYEFRKIAYIDKIKNIRLTQDVLKVPHAIFRLKVDKSTGSIDYTISDSALSTANSYKDNELFKQFYSNGITIDNLRSLFAQEDTTVQLDLNIKSNDEGHGATAYVIARNGVLVNAKVSNGGSDYSQRPTVTVLSSIGWGAVLTPNLQNSTDKDYPGAVAQYDQRRVFAGSYNNPLRVWFTNAGYQDLMVYHLPSLDTDRIEITAVTSDADRIKHLVAVDSLLLLTGSSELRVFTQNSDALTPSSVAVRAQSFIGANKVQPLICNNTVIYASQRGGHVRALGYNYQQSGYTSSDISVRAPHLFDGKDIVSLALQKSPIQVLWAVTSDGVLLSCTFTPEQSQIAWARHSTLNGKFESVCCISEGTEDHLYAVVIRDQKRYIERMSNFQVSNATATYRYLDCYLDGVFSTAKSQISGLSHLEGKTVSVFVDGKQQSNKKVVQGMINLDTAGKNIAVGLPIDYNFVSVPLIVSNTESELQGRTKNISQVQLRVSYEGDLYSRNYPHGKEYMCSKVDQYSTPTDDDSYLVKVVIDGAWEEQSQFAISHKDCLPVEIQSVILAVSYEDGK